MPKLNLNTEIVGAITEYLNSVEPKEIDAKIRAGTLYVEVDLSSDIAEELVDLSDEEESLENEVSDDSDE